MWEWTPPSETWPKIRSDYVFAAYRGFVYQTKQVQPTIAILRSVHALQDVLVFMELALFDRYVDPDDVLPDDTARTDVQMTG